jgi:O-methyltransferase involved in polyketide biosynthesis
MQHYYYDTKAYVWSSWTDSELHDWLVAHGIVRSEARIQRDKLVKMVGDNYANAQDTVWSAWSDSQMREWLIEHGYLRTDAQKTRDELIKMMNAKVQNFLSSRLGSS